VFFTVCLTGNLTAGNLYTGGIYILDECCRWHCLVCNTRFI